VSKKARRSHKARYQEQQSRNDVIDFGKFKRRESKVQILPKNLAQEDYLALLDNPNKNIVFAVGPAGTGKTMIAVLAAIKALKSGECEKIVVTRPAVSVDEQHGFLPGDLKDKMAPWTRPIFDVLEEYYSPKEIEVMLAESIIEIAPLAYMRGRTFKNSWIVADEMQNATESQMKMLLTRIGVGSRIIVTGDLAQHDRGYENNGLKDFIAKVSRSPSDRIDFVKFDKGDVERHPAVSEVLNIYGDVD
jgi:phosphate starvation-inducible PhoH-like protein